MATKLLTAILFMSKLFPNFRSNDVWHIDISWNKVVCADSTGTHKWYLIGKSLGTTDLMQTRSC